jgi:hypothetical protein
LYPKAPFSILFSNTTPPPPHPGLFKLTTATSVEGSFVGGAATVNCCCQWGLTDASNFELLVYLSHIGCMNTRIPHIYT